MDGKTIGWEDLRNPGTGVQLMIVEHESDRTYNDVGNSEGSA